MRRSSASIAPPFPESLIEAELFGFEKGAFTGAAGVKKGMFEMAEGGTLFLDEIGEMPIALQAKLLGVLDDRTFRRLGGTTVLQRARSGSSRPPVSTSRNAIRTKKFREDLYYRLGVIKMHLPPLRERKEDLAALCEFLIARAAKGRKVRLAEGELEKLKHYDWPGNVRELKNVLERAVILQQGEELRPSEFLEHAARKAVRSLPGRKATEQTAPSMSMDEVEKGHILSALAAHDNNYSRAARAIGISLSTLKRRLKKYQLL